VLIAVLLLSLNFYSHWHWLVKFVATTLAIGFFVVTYHSYSAILGWPNLDRGMGNTVPRAYGLAYTPKLHDKVNKASRKLRKGLPVIGQVAKTAAVTRDTVSGEEINVAGDDLVFVDAPQALVPGK